MTLQLLCSSLTSNGSGSVPEGDCIGSNVFLQPEMMGKDLVESILESEDPIVAYTLLVLLQAWSQDRSELPEDFSQRFTIRRIRRQPITGVVLTTQYVARELVSVDRPYTGGRISDYGWATEDAFELAGVETVAFPKSPVSRTLAVDGREEVFECKKCSGKGKVRCSPCSGSGVVTCRSCHGDGEVTCLQCGGDGEVIKPNGAVEACSSCGSTGAVRCQRCRGKGEYPCSRCGGEGKSRCQECRGHGKMKRNWTISERSWIEKDWACFGRDSWSLPARVLLDEAVQIESTCWETANTATMERAWKALVPDEVQNVVQKLLDESARQIRLTNTKTQRATGVRLEIVGFFAYEVCLHYKSTLASVYLAGTKGRVIPNGLPTSPGLVRRWISWFLRNFWSDDEGDVRDRLPRSFVSALRRGNMHPWDVNCLLPQVAEGLRADIAFAGGGYRLSLSVSTMDGVASKVVIDVVADADEMESGLLCAECRLGEAHRDRYPAALSLNQKLSFGRIAVIEEEGTGRKFFSLVDRRPYPSATVAGYTDVLRGLAHDVAGIKRVGDLG